MSSKETFKKDYEEAIAAIKADVERIQIKKAKGDAYEDRMRFWSSVSSTTASSAPQIPATWTVSKIDHETGVVTYEALREDCQDSSSPQEAIGEFNEFGEICP